MKKIFKKNCNYYIFFLIILISVCLASRIDYLNFFNSVQFKVVLSSSMSPGIPTGSFIVLKEIPLNEFSKGDVISFESNGVTVTHRIISIDEKNNIQTQGDANNYMDQGYAEKIDGKVIFHISKFGFLFLILKTVRGKIALLMTLITIILMEEFIKLLFLNNNSKEKEII